MSSNVSLKKDIRDLSFNEMAAYFDSLGEKPYRATQVFEWMYQKGKCDFGGMTNLSEGLKERLKKDFSFQQPVVVNRQTAEDQTTKFLFELNDKERVETV